jgi:cellulose synthase operon protein C
VKSQLRLPFIAFVVCGSMAIFSIGQLQAQVPPDQAADMLLGSARKAYNERNYPFAADRFREFLQKFGGNANAPAARYGLALTLIEMPERKYTEAADQLQQIAGNKNLPEYPFVLYYLGLCKRAAGINELAQALANPNEANQRRDAAKQRFTEAEQSFANAAQAFWAKVKIEADAKQPPIEMEWYCRSVCDQAEMELRLLKIKEARDAAVVFRNDPTLAKSRYFRLGQYYFGYASFLLHDYAAAARSLNRQDMFADAVFGTHARYLMGRIHQHDGELAEAAAAYDAVWNDYNKQKAAAVEALKRPDTFRDNPEEKTRLEVLTKTVPDHVQSALFDAATLQYDGGKYGDAIARFGEFAKQFPNSSRLPEAQLHVGFCQVQMKQYGDAINTLTPLPQKYPNLADQALLWLAKAQALNFDPNNPQAKVTALNTAIQTLKQAADRAGQMVNADPDAKFRRGEILLELADTQLTANQNREAIGVYEQIINEKVLPDRAEEIAQRLASAYHLVGDFAKSDQICDRFLQEFPQSPLRPKVYFRKAENAYFIAINASKNPNLPNRAQEMAKLFDEAGKRFQFVIDKFPEFERISLARYSLAMAMIQKGEHEKAVSVLEAIPAPDRTGELALTPYILADCLIRLTPLKAEDAVAAGKVQEQLQAAAQLLDSFVGSNAQAPEAPDALLKLGYCQQRLAVILAAPPEKQAAIQAGRVAYEKLQQQYPKAPQAQQAVFERAKCLLLAGDRGGAMNEMRRFLQPPLQDSTVAPMAVIRLATLLREQNQSAEAAKVLDECRKKHEQALSNDKERSSWVSLLRYHHSVALLESGKPGEAQGLLDQVVQAPDKPIAAEAALRSGQCRVQEAKQKLDAARQRLGMPNLKPEEKNAAQKSYDDAVSAVRNAGQYLEQQSEGFKQALPNAESRARMLYDAAWVYRSLADMEIAAVRDRMQQEQQKKLVDEAQKKLPAGSPPLRIPLPEIARPTIPLQPSEDKARSVYRSLIKSFEELPLVLDARFELAEMLAERAEFDATVAILKEALDKEPPQELTDRIRLRLGDCLMAKKDFKGALAQFDSVTDVKSPSFPQANYRAGECLIDQTDFAKAATRLAMFRDKGEFQNIPGLSDRALLRLGYALGKANQWDPSRQANELLTQRFGNSPWIHEARYGIGWARQNQKQYDEAVNAYQQVANAVTTDLAAKAFLQIGLCRLEQKRYAEAASALLIVPTTFDFPELNAAALCEAARCYLEMKNHEQAERLLQKVLKDHAESEWAKVAKERLEALKKG